MRPPSRIQTALGLTSALALLLVAVACSEGQGPTTGPDSPTVSGSIEVTLSTTGDELDIDGYRILLDDSLSQPLGVNDRVVFPNVPEGDHTVELDGLAGNCAIGGANPRTLTVVSGSSVATTLEVVCVLTFHGRILFQSRSPDSGALELYVMEDDGSGQRSLTEGLVCSTFFDGLSPDGGRLAFTRASSGMTPEIYVVNADGTGLTNLSNHPQPDFCAAWRPRGGEIAFVCQLGIGGVFEIHTMNLAGGDQVKLSTDSTRFDFRPVWRPDGQRVLFVSATSVLLTSGDLHVMNADGSGRTNLTGDPAAYRDYSWRPDGTRILFESNRDNQPEIYVMNADGTDLKNLSNHVAEDLFPAWSPDGTRVAFVSNRDGQEEIYVVNADGTGTTRLTDHPADDRHPAWSPDGTRIGFASNRDGDYEIYVMNADGSDPRNLTHRPGSDERFHTWVP